MYFKPRITFHGLFVGLLIRSTNGIPDTTLCAQYGNVTDLSNTYTFSTNVWGLDDSGASCMTVYENATTMSTTWAWTENRTLVHAYPNINYDRIQQDPIQLSNLSSLDVRLSWSMKPEMSTSMHGIDTEGLAEIRTEANVAIDVFFDEDIARAVNTTAPRYEMMVWIGSIGAILPIGAADHDSMKQHPKLKVGKHDFYLYQGNNDNGQYVYSWIANSNLTVFDADISPLLHYLWRNNLVLPANYVGVVQIGTEQKHAMSNVSFFMGEFAVNTTRGVPKSAGVRQRGGCAAVLVVCFVALLAGLDVF